MSELKIKNGVLNNIGQLLYFVMVFIILLSVHSYHEIYSFFIVIIRLAVSSLIISLMFNNKGEYKYINFIGMAYIISSIWQMFDISIGKNGILNKETILIAIVIETIGFLVALIYINKFYFKYRKNSLQKLIGLVCLLGIFIFKLNETQITILINLLILLYVLAKCKKIKPIEYKCISKILIIKNIYIVCVISNGNIFEVNNTVHVLVDMIGMADMYMVYKVTIYLALINPYMKIININKKIENQSKVYENINNIIKKVNESQIKINDSIVYNKQILNAILDTSPNGMIRFDKNNNITEINRAANIIFNNEEEIKDSINRILINNEIFNGSINISLEEQNHIQHEIELNNKIYNCSYSMDKNKEYICLLSDISEEKDILNKMIISNEEYEGLISNIEYPVLVFGQDYNLISIGKRYELFLGKETMKLFKSKNKLDIDALIEAVVHPDDIQTSKLMKMINSNAKNDNELYNEGTYRFRIVNYRGEELWLESRTKIYYEGNKRYIMITYSDISKYMYTRRQLEKAEKVYKGLLDSIPEGIYLEDIETNEYVFINKKFRDIFDIDQEYEMIGLCREDFMKVLPEYNHIVNKNIKKIKENEICGYDNLKYVDSKGNIIDAKVASIPFRIGNKVYKLTIIKDMKDIIKIEKLRREIVERNKADRIKMEFFINMSHELKTPLNLIFTSTQLIESLYNKNKIKDDGICIDRHIQITKQNSYRLLKIINDLIDFTKMESGFYKLRMENRDIISLVESISMSVVSYANIKGIDIIFDTDSEELIMGIDVNAIERIVLNILSNAIKFTPSGGSIYINMYDRGETLDIVIQDTGIGIEADKIDLIFDRFNDVNKGFIGNVYGSGIGLSMVKSMINLIGAEINVESEYGKGTKFTITLDVYEASELKLSNNDSYSTNGNNNIERLIVDMTDIYN